MVELWGDSRVTFFCVLEEEGQLFDRDLLFIEPDGVVIMNMDSDHAIFLRGE